MNNSYYNVSHSRDYYKGKSVEFAGEWVPGVRYFNDEYLNSLVVYTEKDAAGHVLHSALLACKKTHISSENSSVPDSTNNQPILIIDDTLGVTGIGPNDYWIFISGSLAGTPGKFSEIVNTYLEALALANENNIGKVVFVKEEKSIYTIVGAGELKKIVYTPEFSESLNNKVDKERGKGLSTNDYSNTEKAKLKGIEENAQRNIIEEVHLNGDKIEPIDKVVSFDAVTSIEGQTGNITLKGDSENTWDVNSHIVEGQIQSKVVTPKSVGSSTTPVYFDENGEVAPIDVDTEATENSDNLITSGAVHRNLNLKQETIMADLASEAQERETSDNTLGARINEEAAARITGDEVVLAKVTEEKAARESADAALSESIEYLKRGKAYVMDETLIFHNYGDVQIIGNTLKF